MKYIKNIYDYIYKNICHPVRSRYKVFAFTFFVGLLTHFYILTNLFVNLDVANFVFSLGETLTEGRWGLKILDDNFETYNMPWLNGVVTLAFAAASVCLIVEIFDIKKLSLQCLFGGLFVVFPGMTATLFFMFTSAAYGFAIFLSFVALRLITQKGWHNFIIAFICLVFATGIYQAYAFLFLSFVIVYLIRQNFVSDSGVKFLKEAVKYLVFFVAAIGAYVVINRIEMNNAYVAYNDYSVRQLSNLDSISDMIGCVLSMWGDLAAEIGKGAYGIVTTKTSCIMHFIIAWTSAALGLILVADRPKKNILYFILLLAVLPLCINGTRLLNAVNEMTAYGFTSLYLLFVVIVQGAENSDLKEKIKKDIPEGCIAKGASVVMVLVIAFNIFGANRAYLQYDLESRNMEAYYTSIVTQIKSMPEFTADKKVALVGFAENNIWDMKEFGDFGARSSYKSIQAVNMYSRTDYVRRFLGFDAEYAHDKEIEDIKKMPEFQEMGVYPYYGSIKVIDDFIVVKLGE